MKPRTTAALAAVVLLVCLTGCGQVYREEVTTVAGDFHRAYESGDGAGACAELAPKTRSELEKSAGKPCDQAVLEEEVRRAGEPVRVQVFGTQAQVEYAEETTFLARFQDGWKVMATGCTPQPGKSYDCVISGG